MKREISYYLNSWLSSKNRKPLIIRGARQVGKTWVVRELAKENNRQLIEINFERNPDFISLFDSNDPSRIIQNIEVTLNIDINIENSILFLDEIQSASQIISKLRWFYEDMPDLAVIATGSLLEFALKDYNYSMPVGRISYMFLNPLSFKEFLWARGEEKLAKYLSESIVSLNISDSLHRLMSSMD